MTELKRSTKKIAFAGPWITEKEEAYVLDAVRNGWYETPMMHAERLEKKVADYLGVRYAIATHCCTLALHLAAAALGLKEGDEVICTDFSWVATAYAVEYTGAKPVFVDIDRDSWCIDPAAVRAAITEKTKAIMLVHCFGHPAPMDEIMAIAKEHDLRVIEDAAPSMGSEYRGRKTGTFGDFGCFSFQGAKLTVSGEGGVLVTNDKALYEEALLLASMGRNDSRARFWSDRLGFQYTIANLTAALALAQVERIDELIANKRKIFGWYAERLAGSPHLELLSEREGCFSNYCYPSMLLAGEAPVGRDELLKKLESLNIHARPAFPRMSRFPMHEIRFENPVATEVERQGLNLPAAANLTEEDVDFVCRALKQAAGS